MIARRRSASSGVQGREKASRRQGYDSAKLCDWFNARSTKPVVPSTSNRIRRFAFNKTACKQRHRIENAFCRLKRLRRIFTRYDRLPRNFLASVWLAAAIVWSI